jgi:glycine dehydrogenase subunit 1
MSYLYATESEQQEMLAAIGVQSIEELFASIPVEYRMQRQLDLPAAKNELELFHHMAELASANAPCGSKVCFLGGGAYDHFVPAAVDMLASRGEFYTSYTPYQAEVSQGNLQAIFEYQSLVCQLTGMEVSNASLYDGGSAAVEGVLMCMHSDEQRSKVVVSETVHPEYRETLKTYLHTLGGTLVTVASRDGQTDLEELSSVVDNQTSAVLVQHPNFLGCLEPMEELVSVAKQHGARVVQSFDPISLGLLKKPGEYGVDVAVAEGQCLGNPLLYGGPYLGMIACREDLIRRMPGRIAGETLARGDKRCWVLTLQTREQHIRREKATSNICSNQALFALRASIYLSLLGPQGLREVGEHCLRKSHYLQSSLCRGERFESAFKAPFFKEFVVRDREGQVAELLQQASSAGFFAGIDLGRWYPQWKDCFLVAVTEKRTQAEMDRLTQILNESGVVAETVHA